MTRAGLVNRYCGTETLRHRYGSLFLALSIVIAKLYTRGRPHQGVFWKPGKLFEQQRVLAGLLKNDRLWPKR
jgi:hypothetical protein